MSIRVYFATNRKPMGNADGKIIGFDGDFAPGLVGLRFGQAMIADDFSRVESLDVLPDSPEDGSQSLFNELQTKMAEQGRDTMIVVHGYATSFEQFIIGLAKTKVAYKNANLNLFGFSWPSDGKNVPPMEYANDRHDAECSGESFKRGLRKLMEFYKNGILCGQKIHYLAHSMGNYVTRHWLQALIDDTKGTLPQIFENVFLMAADEDADAFEPELIDGKKEGKFERLPEIARNVHVYFNNHDKALQFSDLTKNNPQRLGYDGPNKPWGIAKNVTLLDVSRLEGIVEAATTLGHGYYDTKPEVIRDVLEVLKGTPPDLVPGRIYDQSRNRRFIGKFS